MYTCVCMAGNYKNIDNDNIRALLFATTSTISLMLYSQLYRAHFHYLVIGGFQSAGEGERYEIQGHSHKIH